MAEQAYMTKERSGRPFVVNNDDLVGTPEFVRIADTPFRSHPMQEIQNTIDVFYQRMDVIEKSLKSSLLSDEARDRMDQELKDITKNVTSLESDLKNLRRENSKTFAFAVLLMFFSFLCYGLYVMTYGPPQH